jgi:hypothetical protein
MLLLRTDKTRGRAVALRGLSTDLDESVEWGDHGFNW